MIKYTNSLLSNKSRRGTQEGTIAMDVEDTMNVGGTTEASRTASNFPGLGWAVPLARLNQVSRESHGRSGPKSF